MRDLFGFRSHTAVRAAIAAAIAAARSGSIPPLGLGTVSRRAYLG